MNIDAEIKAATERINRSIGQKCRHAHAEIQLMAQQARLDLEKRFQPAKPDWYMSSGNGFLGVLMPELMTVFGSLYGIK